MYLRFDLGLDLRLTLVLVDTQHPAHPVYVLLLHPREMKDNKKGIPGIHLYVRQMGSASIRPVDWFSAGLLHNTFWKYAVYRVSVRPLSRTAVNFRSVRDRSIPGSLQKQISTKSSISRLPFFVFLICTLVDKTEKTEPVQEC